MPRADEILVWAGLSVPGNARLPSDNNITTTCETCGEAQSLAEADFADEGGEAVYVCRNGCQPILIVGAPGERPWPGRGYRIRAFTLRNPADLFIWLIDPMGNRVGPAVQLPASPAALADESEAPET